MAMGKRKKESQQPLFVSALELPQSVAHPFYAKLNEVLAGWKFDPFVEEKCQRFYADKMGRPSLEPGKYFRLLLLGYFEGIDSERGIAWRCSDSLSLRGFVGYALNESVCDHSTISRTRRLIDLETHQEVFAWVLKVLADYDLVSGKTAGIDATTLEANAAMRSIVRKDTRQNYQDFLTDLAKASGIDTPTREDLAKLDKTRKNKASNDDWENPFNPDAKIAKMKDGRTHLAYKAEHVVDLESDLVLAAEIRPATAGDAETITDSVLAAQGHLDAAATLQPEPDGEERIEQRVGAGARIEEVTADKGYHKASTLELLADLGIRTYIPEPKRQHKSRWRDKPAKQKQAVYANRRRTKRAKGKHLQRRRSEKVERSFAHICETGGARRTWLRGLEKIRKRYLLQAAAYDLGVVMRKLFGMGKPKTLQKGGEGVFARTSAALLQVWATCWALVNRSPWRPLRGRPLPPTPSAYPATRLAG